LPVVKRLFEALLALEHFTFAMLWRRQREAPPPAHEAQAKFIFAGHAEWSVLNVNCYSPPPLGRRLRFGAKPPDRWKNNLKNPEIPAR
jgi:hypothetical protein